MGKWYSTRTQLHAVNGENTAQIQGAFTLSLELARSDAGTCCRLAKQMYAVTMLGAGSGRKSLYGDKLVTT